jgi:hypothetical protein
MCPKTLSVLDGQLLTAAERRLVELTHQNHTSAAPPVATNPNSATECFKKTAEPGASEVDPGQPRSSSSLIRKALPSRIGRGALPWANVSGGDAEAAEAHEGRGTSGCGSAREAKVPERSSSRAKGPVQRAWSSVELVNSQSSHLVIKGDVLHALRVRSAGPRLGLATTTAVNALHSDMR